MNPDAREKALQEGRRHLRFVVGLYRLQLAEGRHFLHENHMGLRPGENLAWSTC